jgi:hypothetical protein
MWDSYKAELNAIKVSWTTYFSMKINGSETKGVTEMSKYFKSHNHLYTAIA